MSLDSIQNPKEVVEGFIDIKSCFTMTTTQQKLGQNKSKLQLNFRTYIIVYLFKDAASTT